MERNWMLVFKQHDTEPPTATGQLQFDNGDIIKVFSGTWDEGLDYVNRFAKWNDIKETEISNAVCIVEIT